MKKYILFCTIIVSVLLSGCIKRDPQAIGPYPNEYKKIVKNFIDKKFYDPYSLRSVSISLPKEGHIFFNQGWIVCLQANAKNRMGGYTGLSKTAFLIKNHIVVNNVNNSQICNNSNLIYMSWDEMENRQ